MYFDGVSKAGGLNDLNSRKIEQQKALNKDTENKQDAVSQNLGNKDSAQISVNASEVSRYQELVRIHREAYGTTERTSKLEEVKQKIKDGYYDDPEVMDRLSDQIIENTAADRVKAKDMDAVKSRKETGFYDRPEVINRTAENVIRNVMPNSKEE